jgi:hypothetical protein
MCDSGTNDNWGGEAGKVRIFKVFRPDEGGKYWVTRDWASILDGEFDGAQNGDRIIIELGEMTEHAIAKLPDFDGW